MRALFLRLLHPACASLLGLAMAGPAYAAVMPVTGSLSVAIGAAPNELPTITAVGSGSATLNAGPPVLSSVGLAGGTFAVAETIPVTDPADPFSGIKATFKNGAGSFNLGGKMPVQGTAFLCLIGGCAGALANITVPFTMNGTRGVGLGGAPIFLFNKADAIGVTVNGAPWVATTAKVGTITLMGFVHGPASGGAATAQAASGVVQLVTPTLISTTIGAVAVMPAFGVLNLHFVPEPGTLLLLASGVVGLAVAGLRRRRVQPSS